MTQLREALGVGRGDVVSFVGAGGKTTTAMRLADELSAAGQRVVFTTTTKIMEPIPREGEYLLLSDDADRMLARLPEFLARYPRVILAHHRLEESETGPEGDASYPFPVRANKVKGIAAETVDHLAQLLGGKVPLLVEADGAKHRSLKAPALHEPVVPASTTLLVPMASLHVLGKPLSDEHVFRPERVAALSGAALGEPVTTDMVAAVLIHPRGGLKGVPPQARVVPVLNQWAGKTASAEAREVAELVLRHERIQRVVIVSLQQADPVLDMIEAEPLPRPQVAAIVLAAGASTRYGQPKQLLPVGGKTMLHHVVDVVLNSPVDQIIVVLGHLAGEIGATLKDTPAEIVINEEWEAGLSTSVQAGLRAIRPDVQAALFVLADQPAITPEVIAALLRRYQETGAPIVVPTYQRKRGNPALFDQALFAELMEVRNDQGGRQLVDRYGDRTERVEVGSEAVLLDVDTKEDYSRFKMQRYKTQIQDARCGMQNDTNKLRPIQNLIIDMDGVLYQGDEAIPGVKEFFAFLRARPLGFILATNNSTRAAQQYRDKLARMGVEVALSEILTSSQATAMYLATLAPPGTKVYVIGEEGLETAVREKGYMISGDGAEFVVVGMDRRLTYEKLKVATLLIRKGARFIGSNPDKTLPTEEGLIPGAGAMQAALQASTGVAPIIIGKPERTIFELALAKLGSSQENTAIVGDRLDTDVLGGYHAGLTTILVLSGATNRQDVDSASVKPDLVFEDIRHLHEAWRQL